MTQAKPQFASFEDYLALDPEELPEGRFEYVDGELVAQMPESSLNDEISTYLFLLLVNIGISFRLIKTGTCEIEVAGRPRTRIPDLVILREEHPELTRRRLTITRQMPPPRLIAEVISSGMQNRQRDTIDKRRQYAEINVPEYWLIDPETQTFTVLQLENGYYIEHGVFRGNDGIHSVMFGALPFITDQVLKAGK
ncbi:MAG: Uma2 family endonuclease [Tildeniella nuda ZEHNDER 1965/U140]|jgi:Uma2 family endonuclease|nr:Uma2 family endonuclease [Tildeniella nuda ZEHNDER 1965/U140]